MTRWRGQSGGIAPEVHVSGSTTLINGQPVARDIADLASDEDGVDTQIVGFFDTGYVRSTEQVTAIGPAPVDHGADTVTAPSPGWLRR